MKRFLVRLFLGANVCNILFLWMCVLTTFIQPDYHPRLSLVGLAFPAFVAVNIAFVFFWLIFHARYTWVPLAGMLAVGGYCLDYCPMHFADEPQDSTLCMVSFNVGAMNDDERREELRQFICELNPDILCMQEINEYWITVPENKQIIDSLGYHVLQSNGQTTLSKFPILGDSVQIQYPTRKSNGSLACWLDVEGDSVLLINNHLESNHLSEEEKADYKQMIKDPENTQVEEKSRELVGKLSEAAHFRGSQTDTICAMVKKNEGKELLVCGDFNDTPISYTYQKVSRLLTSAFRQSGSGLGISYNQRGFFVRIDHIFVSDGWESVYTCVDSKITVSDHYPIITYLRKKHK